MMKLRVFRERDKISQIELAERVGVAQNTICQWENGARRPNIDMLIRLTEIFGCTADELLGIDQRKPAEEEKPETRGQEISVRMSEAFADARKRQEA